MMKKTVIYNQMLYLRINLKYIKNNWIDTNSFAFVYKLNTKPIPWYYVIICEDSNSLEVYLATQQPR